LNPVNELVKKVILLLVVATGLLATEVRFTRHVGEYYALLLLAAVGMLLLVSTENLLMIFISLELTSLCLYVLTAFNEKDRTSAEAGLKYFLFGGMSAAFLLFGLSYLYGLTGEITLSGLAIALQASGGDPLLNVGLAMILIGFGFKLAIVPFHFWAPDVYQGAPVPSAVLIASASKVAGIYVFSKVLFIGFAGWEWGRGAEASMIGWVPMVAFLAVFSMIFGNFAALRQTSVRRLLAYSAIAHSGYLLVGLLIPREQALAPLLFYVITYAVTTVGAFGVVAAVQGKGRDIALTDLAGLSRRAPLLSVCLMILILSLAGIPPLTGFVAKIYLFAEALKPDPENMRMLWVIIIGIVMSAVSLYYYLQILKQVFVAKPTGPILKVKVGFLGHSIIGLLAILVVVLGVAPEMLLNHLVSAVTELVW